MRSSESFLVWFALHACLLAACSAPAVEPQTAAQSTAIDCTTDRGLSRQDAEAAITVRRSVEAGPLYGALAGSAAVASCRIGATAGAPTLEYMFGDGGTLRVTRDARIEYTNLEARFASPPAEDGVAVLTRTEQAAFDQGGCGIDWRQPDSSRAGDIPTTVDTIYRGDVCNCQARVRADAAGRVVGLLFRSAC